MIASRPSHTGAPALRRLAGTALLALLPLAHGQLSTTPNTVYLIAGGTEGSADGVGPAAQFNREVNGVNLAPDGSLYIVDTENSTVRRILPDGTVSTLAGVPRSEGSADGTGAAARFRIPHAGAVDPAGNLYLADMHNHTIRKVTPGGTVTTVAGMAQQSGSTDGIGSAARFYHPSSVALDAAGNLYVTDSSSFTIRKVTPAGVVTTVAGAPLEAGSTDGPAATARFYAPGGIVIDSAGNLYVSEYNNKTVRKITPAGMVSTFAGAAGQSGVADGPGASARFQEPLGLAIDAGDNLYLADSAVVRKITPAGVVSTVAGGTIIGSLGGTIYNVAVIGPERLAVTGPYKVFGVNLPPTVQYAFSGFFPPVDNAPVVNVANAGSAIPVKFSLGGNRGLAIFASGYPGSQAVGCNAGSPTDVISETASSGSGLTYDAASDQYKYVWKTDKAWKASCRQLILKLNDGSEHRALFQFK